MDIGGSWLSQRGEMFVIEQEGTTVRLLSQDFTGQQLVTGQGALEGSELDAALVDLASGRAAQLHITVSPDGQTMSGSAVEQATGNRQEIQLVRQE